MSIQLQNLSNEYNMLISQYQDTYQKYIDVINSDNKSFTTVDNSAFYGQNQINTLNNTNVENCQSAYYFITHRLTFYQRSKIT